MKEQDTGDLRVSSSTGEKRMEWTPAIGIKWDEGRLDEVIKVQAGRSLALTTNAVMGTWRCCGYRGLISLPDRLAHAWLSHMQARRCMARRFRLKPAAVQSTL